MPRDFLKTGITGLDTILLGGLPRGNIAVLTGGPGTGKTTLGTSSCTEAHTTTVSPD